MFLTHFLILTSQGALSLAPVPPRLSSRTAPTGLKALSPSSQDEIVPASQRVRTASVLALWGGLITYTALGAPGQDAASAALDADLLAKLIANPFDPSVPALFVALFNAMGLWPAVAAALVLPGAKDQKLPAAPFLLLSVAFGMFALSPYVAFREIRDEGCRAPEGVVGRWFESKANAAFLAAGGVGIGAIALSHPDLDAYLSLFQSQLFVHVTTLDFCSLTVLAYGLLEEDARRREGAENLKYLGLIPLYGPLVYLLLRPPLPGAGEEK